VHEPLADMLGANAPSYSAIHLHIENNMKRAEIFNEKISQFTASLLSLGHKIRRKDNFCAAGATVL